MSTEQDRRPAIGDFRFKTEYMPSKTNPNELVAEDWVDWLKIGDQMASRTGEKISRLMPKPDRGRPAALEWEYIRPAYEAWKKGQEMPVSGTPLAAWPGCDPGLAKILRDRSIVTVEQFADIPDHYMAGIPMPDIRARRTAAKAFLEAKNGRDAAKEAMADEIAALRAEMAKMIAGDDDEPAKPRRGRPPKAAAEAVHDAAPEAVG